MCPAMYVSCMWLVLTPAILQPPYGAFGAKYIMEIPDTVVEGHEGFTEGSEEYMVFEKVLLGRAAHHGLYPVSADEQRAC